MLYLIMLIGGFVPLIYGANLLVDNASSLAKKRNIPDIVIGLTIVAFGTSAPELIVNVFGAVNKNSDIVLGNVIGSNIFNILLILGVSAIVYPLAVKRNTTWIEIPLALLAALAVIALANDQLVDKLNHSTITRIDGFILLLFFSIFLVYNYNLARSETFSGEIAQVNRPYWGLFLLIGAGLALLVLGGKLIVTGAVQVASWLGMTERVVSLTIVAAGTSLPELATSVVAARKKNSDIAIGNIVGSNIFNVFLILGISSVIYPVQLQPQANIDLLFHILVSILLFVFVFTGKRHQLNRMEGILFVLLYIGYVTFLIVS